MYMPLYLPAAASAPKDTTNWIVESAETRSESVESRVTELEAELRCLCELCKPGNISVVAVMRKLLVHLNAVARRGTPRVPQAG